MDQSVVEHYASAGLDNANVQNYLDLATSATWRFVRLNPRFPVDEVLSQLTAEIGVEPVRVPWLPENARFFAIPGATTIKNLSTYEEGKIYGMDCSSGAAVAALGLNNNIDDVSGETRVLDLCCCPGAKLCMIVDELLGLRMEVVGVDISDSRLNISKKLLRKYIINTDANTLVKLFHADGTTFPNPKSDSLVFDSRAEAQETASSKSRKRMNKSARAREKKRLKELGGKKETEKIEKKEEKTDEPAARGSDSLFDYVLVDAECSTDGALSHLKHKNKSLKSSETVTATIKKKLDDEGNLTALQLSLLNAGFKNLRVGGTIVYATCSLSAKQNEGVVQAFIEEHKGVAEAVPIDFGGQMTPAVTGPHHSLRFSPTLTTEVGGVISGGGFFLCKFIKK